MNKFDELYNKLISECTNSEIVKEELDTENEVIKEEADIEQEYQEKVKELFAQVLADEACDLAEIQFKDDAEKQSYIDNAIANYIEDIEAHIEGEKEPEEFMTLADDVKRDLVKAAIADNSEAIFGKDIFA
jgi:hypothetical protein